MLARTWAQVKEVMAAGALDPLVKEMIYIAVSVTNNCEYCIHSHTAAARGKGMTPQMFDELIAVTALANATNRLANGYRIDVDERFASPLAPLERGVPLRTDEPPCDAVLGRHGAGNIDPDAFDLPFNRVTWTTRRRGKPVPVSA
jgi:AhpD family alkylhydroperoxidase